MKKNINAYLENRRKKKISIRGGKVLSFNKQKVDTLTKKQLLSVYTSTYLYRNTCHFIANKKGIDYTKIDYILRSSEEYKKIKGQPKRTVPKKEFLDISNRVYEEVEKEFLSSYKFNNTKRKVGRPRTGQKMNYSFRLSSDVYSRCQKQKGKMTFNQYLSYLLSIDQEQVS
jgi:hypothetical protein